MPFNFFFGISIRFVHPFDIYRIVTFGKGSKFLSVILHDGFYFFIHCDSLFFILSNFLKVDRLTISKEEKKSEIIKSLTYFIKIL